MSLLDEMMDGVTPPAPPEKSTWDKVKTGISNIPSDIGTSLTDYATGAIQGIQEIGRQSDSLAETNPLALSGTPMGEGITNTPAPQQTEEQQQSSDQYQSAIGQFAEGAIKPPLLPAAIIGTAATKTVAGILYAPFMAHDAYKSYEDGGGGVDGALKVTRDFTYGGVVDFASQDNLGQQFQDRPVSTTINGILAAIPPLLIGGGLYKTGKGMLKKPSILEDMGVTPTEPTILSNVQGETAPLTAVEILSKDIPAPTVKSEVGPNIKGNDIITAGETQLGKPYGLGADGVNATDCGLFTQQTLGANGVELKYRTADGQYLQMEESGKAFANQADAQVGDLVFFDVPSNRGTWSPSNDPASVNSSGEAYKGVTHVGIYAGEGKVLQAGSRGVSYADINAFGDIVGFGKVAEDGAGVSKVLTNEESLSKAHDYADEGDYTSATEFATKAGDREWSEVYKRMDEREKSEPPNEIDAVDKQFIDETVKEDQIIEVPQEDFNILKPYKYVGETYTAKELYSLANSQKSAQDTMLIRSLAKKIDNGLSFEKAVVDSRNTAIPEILGGEFKNFAPKSYVMSENMTPKQRFLNEITTETDGSDANKTITVKRNFTNIEQAKTGSPISFTGFRQETSTAQRVPNTGTFYAIDPGTSGVYGMSRITDKYNPLDIANGGKKSTLTVDNVEFKNPLVIEGGHAELINQLNKFPINEKHKKAIESVWKQPGERKYLLLDKAIARAFSELGHDGIVYRRKGDSAGNSSEIVHFGKKEKLSDNITKMQENINTSIEPTANPANLDAIEQTLRDNVNEVVEPKTIPIGASVKIINKLPAETTPRVKFSNPEIEARWQEASKGVQKESLIAKVKENMQSLWNKASRVYEAMPNTAEFAPLKYDLLKLEKQKGVTSDRTLRIMQGITAGFDKSAMDLFTRKVVLDDLAQTTGDLPFGFTAADVSKGKTIVDQTAKASPAITKAIEMRKKVWDALKTDYVKAMKDIGFNVEDKIGREDYFRHQVLEYANTKAIAGSGQKLQTPTNRGFLREREGSTKDINANYLQAEFEVMAQTMFDTELAKTINRVDKNYSIRTKLFDEFGKDWRDNIPEGYTTWQPREGSSFHMANSIPERLATQVLSGALEEVGISVDQITQVLAKGSPFKELVVKQEIADTLNKIAETPSESAIGKISRSLVTPWKVWTLMSPTRAIKYNLRNITGDADALFTMNPGSFKRVPQATGELFQTIYGDRAMTPEMGEWFRRGGMETTSPIQELQDIGGLRMFENLAEKSPNVIKNAWGSYWSTVKTGTQFREAIFRYATYLDYLKQMEENGGKPKNFGASIPEEVMALSDIRDRAFDLSNKVLGAYDNVGVLGKDIRTHIVPFWSWYETNFKRYAQFFDNQKTDGTLATAISRKFAGNVIVRSPYYAYATGSFVVKAGALWSGLQAYNNLVFPNEEKELPLDEQSRPHIVLGRDESGKVRYFSRLGALPDFLEWFGLDTPIKDVKDYLDGSRSMQEIVKDMGKSPINKLGQGVSPLMKTPAELFTGKKLFPDVFRPSSIKDKAQYVADSFGLGNEFKAITKTEIAKTAGIAPRPAKPYFGADTGENLLYYKTQPNQSSYYNIQDRKREYLKDIGKGGDGDFSSPKTEILRNYKIALRLKDEASASYYLEEYKNLGGTKKTLAKSLESMNPLAGLNEQEKKKFKQSLNGQQQEELDKAMVFYKEFLMGK